MEPSPLEFVSHTHYYRGGDVIVDATAAIAPGVVFRAAPKAAIRIGPGVCVGAGVVIQAKQGCLYIETGVSLGTGVLIVGHGHVGKDACVGPSSTLINPAIAPNTIIPPCSLIEAQASSERVTTDQNGQASSFQAPNFQSEQNPVPSMPVPPRTTPTVQPQSVAPKAVNVPDVETPEPSSNGAASNDRSSSDSISAMSTPKKSVYGRDHLNSLLTALFPHREPLNNGSSMGQSEKDS